MTLPRNLIFVRHGESEGNVVVQALKKGDNSLMTPAYETTPGHQWRLTPTGIEQIEAVSEWLKDNVYPQGAQRSDMFMVSPYIRTIMTASVLNIPNSRWRVNRALREREWGDIQNISREQFVQTFPHSARSKEHNPLYWAPPGGESVAEVAENRVQNLLGTLHRSNPDLTVMSVAHGELMWAVRLVLERLTDQDYFELERDRSQRILNGEVHWYCRGDKYVDEVIVVQPIKRGTTWKAEVKEIREVTRREFTTEELWEIAASIPSVLPEPL